MKMPEPETPELEFRNVCLNLDDVAVLSDVSFKLHRNEMIFLTGISGSGKSVLLHLAIGLLRPTSGEILVKGQAIQNLKEEALLNIRGGAMGMVFQEESLFTGLPVFDNVAYRLEEHGFDEAAINKAVSEVLRFVGLEGEEEKYPEELSGGMKRRVEIARALIGWPSIMLFDEPTSSLDPINALQVLHLIIRARDLNRVSSIYVTKKLYEMPYLAQYRAYESADGEVLIDEAPAPDRPLTKVVVLDAGRIVFAGSLEDFQKSSDPLIMEMKTLEHHDHSSDVHFSDPWDKSRRPREGIL
jgi:phospholipid/cholesterol/gamma-HCH transport system ATP-binding protein